MSLQEHFSIHLQSSAPHYCSLSFPPTAYFESVKKLQGYPEFGLCGGELQTILIKVRRLIGGGLFAGLLRFGTQITGEIENQK